MSDYERYGDYNEIEEDAPKSNNPVMLILKILTVIICVGVVGFLAFRLFIFNSYPDSVKGLYVNDELAAHYAEVGDDIVIKNQSLRAPYDHEDEGNFFCDYLYVIPEADQLQITVRYNTSTLTRIAEKYGKTIAEDDTGAFIYRLYASHGTDENGENIVKIYDVLSEKIDASQLMYRYAKLVFDGVELDTAEGGKPYWIRLEIFIDGVDMKEPYTVPIYENNVEYSSFTDYKLTGSEFQ